MRQQTRAQDTEQLISKAAPMERVRLGRTDLVVSKVGFGGIPIQRLTENEAVSKPDSRIKIYKFVPGGKLCGLQNTSTP